MPFELFKSEKGDKFYFRLKAANGQVVLASEGYNSKAGAENGIQSVIKSAATAGAFEERKAKSGDDYFVLKAGNGEIVGKSQMYKSADGMKKGINSVIENAKAGGVKDLTE